MASYRDLCPLILPIYIPAFLATLAQSLVIAVLPLFVKDGLGGDDAAVGAVTSMQGLGAFMTAGLSGYAIARVGDRSGMILGAIVRCVAYVACLVVTLLPNVEPSMAMTLMACARFATGIGMSAFQVARNSFMAMNVPKALRGRANGLIGGCARVSQTIGPAIGGIVVHAGRGPSAAFIAQNLVGVVNVALLVIGVPRAHPPARQAKLSVQELAAVSPGAAIGHDNDAAGSSGARSSILMPLLTAGPVGFSFAFVRAARTLLIPLKADALDLSAAAVGYITAACSHRTSYIPAFLHSCSRVAWWCGPWQVRHSRLVSMRLHPLPSRRPHQRPVGAQGGRRAFSHRHGRRLRDARARR